MLPFDCIGNILTFNDKIGVIYVVMSLSKDVKRYLDENLKWICKDIRYNVICVKEMVPSWISKLRVRYIICQLHEKYLKNVIDIHIEDISISKDDLIEYIGIKYNMYPITKRDLYVWCEDMNNELFNNIKLDVKSLNHIKVLRIDDEFTFDPIMHMSNVMESLEELDLIFDMKFHMKNFVGFKNLKKLRVCPTNIILQEDIKDIQKIKHLHIDGAMEFKCLEKLKGITSLTVRLYGLKSDARYIRCLSGINYLRITNRDTIHLMDDDIKYLSGIETLIVASVRKITDIGLKYLKGIKKLVLGYCTNISDEGLKNLSGIEHLNICDGSKITDHGLSYLIGIKTLILKGNKKITDIGVKYIANSIKKLVLGSSELITNPSYKHLVKSLALNVNEIHRLPTVEELWSVLAS